MANLPCAARYGGDQGTVRDSARAFSLRPARDHSSASDVGEVGASRLYAARAGLRGSTHPTGWPVYEVRAFEGLHDIQLAEVVAGHSL